MLFTQAQRWTDEGLEETQRQLEVLHPGRAVKTMLVDFRSDRSVSESFTAYAARRLGLRHELLFDSLARLSGVVCVDPTGLPLPKSRQPMLGGLPLHLLASHEAGLVTAVTSLPGLVPRLDPELLRDAFGGVRVAVVVAPPELLEPYVRRLRDNDLLRPAGVEPESLEVPGGAGLLGGRRQRREPDLREARAVLVGMGLLQPEEAGLSAGAWLEAIQGRRPAEALVDAMTVWGGMATGLPYVDLQGVTVSDGCLEVFPPAMQRRYGVCPLWVVGQTVTLAASAPLGSGLRAEIANMLPPGLVESYVLGRRGLIDRLIARNEAKGLVAVNIADKIAVESVVGRDAGVERIDVQELSRKAGDDPATVVDLVRAIVVQGIQLHAADIHISEQPQRMWVRYRIDGVLADHGGQLRRDLCRAVISRIKILAGIDTQFTAVPQDGKFSLQAGGLEYDIRVCTSVTIHGEQAVLRLQPKSLEIPRLESLGFQPFEIGVIRRTLDADHGLLVICGPTGAGKSTTLYSAIGLIDRTAFKVCTAEQPVEIRMANVEQTDIRPESDLTFARFTESVLRQDPDYIMIGETRDRETARQVLRAAITGHTVMTTLHTNSASSAPSRLLDLGCEPYLLADALTAVCSQRLVRRICLECAARGPMPGREEMRSMGVKPEWFGSASGLLVPRGCPRCRGTGHAGRLGLLEAYEVDRGIRDLIRRNAPASEIRACQVAAGGRTLFQQAVEAAAAGLTSLAEALTVGAVEDGG